MRATALAVRFGLELCILASLAAWTAAMPLRLGAKVVLGFVSCTAAAAVWGTLLSPKRRYELGPLGRLLLEGVFFVGTALILRYLGSPRLGVILILVAAADRIALALVPRP